MYEATSFAEHTKIRIRNSDVFSIFKKFVKRNGSFYRWKEVLNGTGSKFIFDEFRNSILQCHIYYSFHFKSLIEVVLIERLTLDGSSRLKLSQ